jgi:membrane protein YdbS with pleckstrin-like domain
MPVLAACVLMALLAGWLPARLYSAHRYRVNDVYLELCSGIFWRKSVLIPISRVQHLDLQRGPFERRFGLATLQVHTAGTRSAIHRIPGLDAQAALLLRERLAASADLVIK